MISTLLTPLALVAPLTISPEYTVEPTLQRVDTGLVACMPVSDWIVVSDHLSNLPNCDELVAAAVSGCTEALPDPCPGLVEYGAERYMELEEKHIALKVAYAQIEQSRSTWRTIAIGSAVLLTGAITLMIVSR